MGGSCIASVCHVESRSRASGSNARLERLRKEESESEPDFSSDVYDPTDVENITDVVPSHVIREEKIEYTEQELRKLLTFYKAAENIKESDDTKIIKTIDIIRKLLKAGYKPIIFCSFIATADYVAKEIESRLKKEFKNIHVGSVTGSLSDEEREIKIEELGQSAVRVLVATDCMSEGINLQQHFNAVLHYDLPWNPNRLEQREGRIDRFGQTSEVVKAYILYGADNPIDGAVLEVLLRKAQKIHKTLGISVPIPVESESVMDSVFHALFLRTGDSPQLGMFDDLPPVVDVQRKWDRAVERERQSRSVFAQHAIRQEEVASEFQQTDTILGIPRLSGDLCRRPCRD